MTVSGSPTTTNYTYDAANRLTNGGYSYDNAGRLTSDGTNSYTWDRANRLLSMGSSSYAYDGAGRRVAQTVSGTTTQYTIDYKCSLWKVIAETTGGNTQRYVHVANDIVSQQRSDGSWNWLLDDGLGSIRSIVNTSLSPLDTRLYTAYGEPTQLSGSNQSPFGYTGQQTDSNQLVYLRARYLQPAIGAFLSLDPLENTNRYGYVDGNPINRIDPSGMVATIRPRMIDVDDGRAVMPGRRVSPLPTPSNGKSTAPIKVGGVSSGNVVPTATSGTIGSPTNSGTSPVSGGKDISRSSGSGTGEKTVFGSSTKGKSTSTSNSKSPFSRRLSQCLPEWLAFIYSWDFPITIAFPWESGCDAETENTGSDAIDIDDLGNKCYHLDLGACDELSRLCQNGVQQACEKLSAAYRGDCSPWVYKPMKERKENSCDRTMRCEAYMPCDVLLTLYGLADDCVTIRWNITQICYRGVEDEGHRTARYNAMDGRNRCREIYLRKVERGQC